MTHHKLIIVLASLVAASVLAREFMSAFAQDKITCQLPTKDTVDATTDVCQKLGGKAVTSDAAAAEKLYMTWKTNSRTEHDKAYVVAQIYLRNFANGPHVQELQAWATAYEKVIASGKVPSPAASNAASPSKSDVNKPKPTSAPKAGPVSNAHSGQEKQPGTGDTTQVAANKTLTLSCVAQSSKHNGRDEGLDPGESDPRTFVVDFEKQRVIEKDVSDDGSHVISTEIGPLQVTDSTLLIGGNGRMAVDRKTGRYVDSNGPWQTLGSCHPVHQQF
jgi:hypothetical protein